MPPAIPSRRTRRPGLALLAGIVLMLGTAGAAPVIADEADGVRVITSPDRSDVNLDRRFIRAVFTMRTRTWPDGKPVKVFVLPDESDAHRRFCNELLGMYPYSLRNGWDRAVFTGTGLSPRTVETLEEMEKTVRQTPGAIGYVVRVGGS
jgi:ABC-type phosphate transport system substrate-binding protein